MYQIVRTTRASYVCESTEDKDGKLILTKALELPVTISGTTISDEDMAKQYLKAIVEGKLRTIRVSDKNIESTEEIKEVDSLLKIYIAHIPEAEKRARAKSILDALSDIIGDLD